MIKSKIARSFVAIVTAISVVESSVCAVSEPSRELLSPQNFTKPASSALDRENSIASYLTYALTYLASCGRDLSSIIAEDIPAIQGKKRVSVVSLTHLSDGEIRMVCRTHNTLYDVTVRYVGGNPEVSVRESGDIPARFFPAASLLSFDRTIIEKARDIIRNKKYSRADNNTEDIEALYDELFNVLRSAFVDHGMFAHIDGSGTFFRDNDTHPADINAITSITANADMLKRLVIELCNSSPDLKDGAAAVCNAIGKIFYVQKGSGYGKSVFFYGLAHEILPNNRYYHNDWAWALYHVGDIGQARAELDWLISKHPDMTKYYAEMMYIDINEANRDIEDIFSGRLDRMPAEVFFSKIAGIKMAMDSWRSMAKAGNFDGYPRALSGVGEVFKILANTCKLEALYIDKLPNNRPKKAELITEAICDIAFSAEYLYAGSMEAGKINMGNQAHHADRMRPDIMADNFKMLKEAANTLAVEGYRLPGNIDRIERALGKISSSLSELPIGLATDIEVTVRWLVNYCQAQKGIEKAFRESVLKCNGGDLVDLDTFFAKTAADSADTVFSVNGSAGVMPQLRRDAALKMAHDVSAYYRKAYGLDISTLAVIFVCLNLPKGQDLTRENIEKELREWVNAFPEFNGVVFPGSESEWVALARRLNAGFALGVMTKSDEEEARSIKSDKNKKTTAHAAAPANMLNRADLKKSISASERVSVVSRSANLENLINKLNAWGSLGIDLEVYFSTGVSAGFAKEKDDIETYAKAVAEYLEREEEKGLDKRQKEALKLTGLGFTSRLDDIVRKLKDREAIVKNRVARVKDEIVYRKIVDVKSRLQNIQSRCGGLGSEYVETQMNLLNGYVEELVSIQNEKARDYLSFDVFVETVGRIDAAITELKNFAVALETFRPYLNEIGLAITESGMQRSFFGRSDTIDKYMERLAEARAPIFEHARRGMTADRISEEEKDFYSSIGARTELLSRIRKRAAENIDQSIRNLTTASPGNEEQRRDGIRREIIGLLNNGLYGGQEPNPVMSRICNLLAPLPGEGEVSAVMENMSMYVTILVESTDMVTPIYWRITERKMRAITRLVPGSVSDEDIALLEKYRNNMEAIIEAEKTLRLSDPEFMARLTRLHEQTRMATRDARIVVGRAYERWNKALGAELTELRALTDAYLKGWKIYGMTDARRAKVISGLTEMIDVLSGGFDYRFTTRDISATVRQTKDILGDLLRPNMFDSIAKQDSDTMKDAMAVRDIENIFGHVTDGQAERLYNDLRTMFSVERDADGTPKSLGLLLISIRPRDTRYVEALVTMTAVAGEDPQARVIESAGRRILDKLNLSEISADPRFEGIKISPEQFISFVMTAIGFYDALKIRNARLGGADIPDIATIELAGAMSGKILDNQKALMEAVVKGMKEENATSATMSEKRDLLRDIADTLGPERARQEKNLSDKMGPYLEELASIFTHGFYRQERVRLFLRNTVSLLNRVTGKDHPLPDAVAWNMPTRLFLTMPENRPASISSVYPSVKEYAGIYMDTSKGVFKVRSGYETSSSTLLCEALNNALNAYLGSTLGPGDRAVDFGTDEKWYLAVSGMYKGIKRFKELEVVVAKDIPTRNSMSISGTILFDKDFIEFVTKEPVNKEASAVILGERVFHELGLVAEDKDVAIEDIRRLIQAEEEDQLYRDVIMHERIFSEKPELKQAIEAYTDTMLVDSVTGQKAKFSKVFATKDLYRNIQRWAEVVGHSPDKVKAEIKIFVKDFLDGVNITSRFARFFPSKVTSPRDTGYSPELSMALQSAMALKSEESSILDNMSLKDEAFYSKTRRIVISSALVPECQKSLATEINKRSAEAYVAGLTKDIIEIRPFDYMQSVRSDDDTEVVVLLEKSEAGSYTGDESRLVFEANKVEPILLNGLVAAGRAVAYREMNSLRRILLRLGRLSDSALPSAAELERMLVKDKLRRLPVIFLPPVKILTSEIRDLNRNILKLMQYA